jgi:hypothetical protein
MINSIISNIPMPVEVDVFLNNLLTEAKLDKSNPALKQMMLEDLYTRFDHHITLTIAKHLESDDIETFAKLSALDQDQATLFLQEKSPEMPQILLEAIEGFKQMFLKQK